MNKKIGVSIPWLYKSYPYNASLSNIQKVVEGMFNQHGILVSSIYISEYPKNLTLHFQLYLSQKTQYPLIKKVLKVIKHLFVLLYSKNIQFDISIARTIFSEDKLMSSWFKFKVEDNPHRMAFLTKKTIETIPYINGGRDDYIKDDNWLKNKLAEKKLKEENEKEEAKKKSISTISSK